ncbi:YdcF family protein [Labilibacter sediminis]|nr:YdcF family protein [Labilibacter sediminis]
MFFLISKILSFLLSPIWWVAVLLLLYLILNKNKRRKWLLYGAFGVLMFFSNQFIFYHVAGWWEGELQNPNEIEQYDGIILLGGFSSFQSDAERIRFYQSADRLFQAMELYKKKKANRFIFTGGSARIIVKEKKEGEYIKDYLALLGVPEDSTLVEWESRNTRENALETLAMLKKENLHDGRFLLVTSGFHMKRALGCFKKVGIDVMPYNTDPLQNTLPPDVADAVTPSAGTLALWERLIREWIGYGVYKLKGFV